MPENLSFEAAFQQLSQKVQALEKGGMSLEEATRLFEEGMELVKQCNQLLSQTELKIEQIRETYDETPGQESLLDTDEPPEG
jgi:exodeoxyribonuclease VII small subunit